MNWACQTFQACNATRLAGINFAGNQIVGQLLKLHSENMVDFVTSSLLSLCPFLAETSADQAVDRRDQAVDREGCMRDKKLCVADK